ncbi:penicillin-binding protein 1C [Sphingobium subterraneum]|uniref:peptidoglycan glycosyltransferase n=1 Tax=Sphingobium subterraneum TaxID=627688 RepID=A0A841IZP9_9SPHN|nr:penicillin-binding protein 1C [Sphingobium subterraneum]MBB6124449.1 penicillin-binding protein 1C [Sphingobium subterraneum]
MVTLSHMFVALRRWWPPALLIVLIVFYAAFDTLSAPPRLPDYAQVRDAWKPSEAWLYDRNGRLLDRIRVDYKARRLAWARLDDISLAMRNAVIRGEDRRFSTHGGVDWLALGGAAVARLRGYPTRGASTISMQLAAYLSPQIAAPGARGWLDKLRQMRSAWALEEEWSKDEILEAYLNLAPFRGEAQGIAAGSMTLFGKPPSALDAREAALMAALLPDPAAKTDIVTARACHLVERADCANLPALASAMLAPGRLRALDPGLAPHLANHLLQTPGARMISTLDAALQQVATQALRHQLQGLGPGRVRDGAVIVLDNASGDVLAYVGGVGLGSTADAVDGAGALRQAGSTLKPFLYAQLIERKWLTAASILEDSPVQLDTASGLYVPRNYDNAFLGPVSVRRALANSLNVPAVRALVLDGVQDFRDRLWDLGYVDLNPDGDYYGFSLALGSAEVTLLQQANAYRTLANLGRWSPVRLRKGDLTGVEKPLINPGAAWITADMLADASARSGTFGVDSALRLPFWAAAKTGTSKAMRDNWCIGFSDKFTVAVWVGNLEGDPMRAVSGTAGAAPVWRDIMLALHRNRAGGALSHPAAVTGARITFARTGEIPRTEWFLAGTSQETLAEAPTFARRPRIVNPVSGSVYAADPDIPADRQGLGVSVTGAAGSYRLTLDGRGIGDVSSAPQLPLFPGSHLLALLDESGRRIDQVRFTVR